MAPILLPAKRKGRACSLSQRRTSSARSLIQSLMKDGKMPIFRKPPELFGSSAIRTSVTTAGQIPSASHVQKIAMRACRIWTERRSRILGWKVSEPMAVKAGKERMAA